MKKLLIIIGVTVGFNTAALADWPKKLWEIDLTQAIDFTVWEPEAVETYATGHNETCWVGNVTLKHIDSHSSYHFDLYIHSSGTPYWLPFNDGRTGFDDVRFVNDSGVLYENDFGDESQSSFWMYSRSDGIQPWDELKRKDLPEKMSTIWSKYNVTSHPIALQINEKKLVAWDLSPVPVGNGGNGGGNETANSRITIKTAGPDIALATDGKLGAAELQKSNDLKSWRKLGDVPAEASEVLVTPRESGNEFYRLKKK